MDGLLNEFYLSCSACQKYFERYPGDRDLLWEVEGIGHWHQRTPIATVLQRESLKLKGRRY